MIALSEEDFGTLAICSIRYCHGRETYMPSLVQGIVRSHLKELSDKDLHVLIDDCDYQNKLNLYGSELIDKPNWIRYKNDLLAEFKRRKENDR